MSAYIPTSSQFFFLTRPTASSRTRWKMPQSNFALMTKGIGPHFFIPKVPHTTNWSWTKAFSAVMYFYAYVFPFTFIFSHHLVMYFRVYVLYSRGNPRRLPAIEQLPNPPRQRCTACGKSSQKPLRMPPSR